jgi:hypothetical protein
LLSPGADPNNKNGTDGDIVFPVLMFYSYAPMVEAIGSYGGNLVFGTTIHVFVFMFFFSKVFCFIILPPLTINH